MKGTPGAISEQERQREEEQAQRFAERYRLPFIDLNTVSFDPKLLRTIPVEMMYKYNFIPLKKVGGVVHVAMSDPTDLPRIDELELLLGGSIQVYVGTNSAIQETLKKSESSQRVLDEASEGFKLQVITEEENGEESLSIDRLTTDSSSMIKLVDSIIFTAIQRRASDIHIETRDREVMVKYRIDGVLYQAMEPIDKKFHAAIISRIKVMSELDIAERRVPQDGRFRLKIKGKTIDFRVSIMPSVHGEDAVVRILDKEAINEAFAELRLDLLGFSGPDLKLLRKYISEPYGMVLVTGPTGSGKTTTLYAALSEIKSVEDKIITIEDPVEYQLIGITQVPVNEKKGLTFARGLRSILRHDPDKIMVGEIRDPETAQIAVQSALTGHLVFTTVHANNVIDVLGRLLNMGVEPFNFVSALICIVAQRLVRLLCPFCKTTTVVAEDVLVESGIDPVKYAEFRFPQARGCPECQGTGFKGRSAISEILPLSDRIRGMILDRRPASEIKLAAREEGMSSLRESAVQKVRDGLTTLREINKVTFVE
ncbi:MAG: type II/IV secretion system protein [Acidobacteria bacterium]|nr:type II/IV secretion system protein [Acidobacteriota bacterium]